METQHQGKQSERTPTPSTKTPHHQTIASSPRPTTASAKAGPRCRRRGGCTHPPGRTADPRSAAPPRPSRPPVCANGKWGGEGGQWGWARVEGGWDSHIILPKRARRRQPRTAPTNNRQARQQQQTTTQKINTYRWHTPARNGGWRRERVDPRWDHATRPQHLGLRQHIRTRCRRHHREERQTLPSPAKPCARKDVSSTGINTA